MTIDTARTLAELVNDEPGRARVLERLDLDYCCDGGRSLSDACATAGLDLGQVTHLLDDVGSGEHEHWAELGPAQLADHLETLHHAYLWEELPRLTALVDTVVEVHGARHPELGQVRELLHELRGDLEPHLVKEERVLFPMIRELAEADRPLQFHCGSVRNPISVMLAEHDRAGVLLRRLRDVTGDYVVPADACASYAALYRGLAELEADTHLHIHKENNLLFPAVETLEARLESRAS